MTTPARIVHQTAGRIRIEVPDRRGDRDYFAALAEQLAQSGPVARARGNAAAASLVLEYGGPLAGVLEQLERCALRLTGPTNERAAGAALLGGTWERNPMLVVGALFGAVGLVQTARGEIMLPALSAFWYAASALRLARLPINGLSAKQAAIQANSTLP
jgi:hypothetical protein